MSLRREAWLEIDLSAIQHNLELIRSLVRPAAVAPVVKADAYGHGLLAVAQAIAPLADALCVATLDEAVALRAAVPGRIVLLYPAPHAAVPEAVALGVELAVMSEPDLHAVQAAATHTSAPAALHLGVETGMGRGGLPPEAVARLTAEVHADPRLRLAGLWSHLHSPEDPSSSLAQLRRFELVVDALVEARLPLPPRHVAATGGIFAAVEPVLEMVRPGLAIYGVLDEALPVAPGAAATAAALRPSMALKARPVAFSDVPAGGTVGYGGTWRAERPARIAVLPVGYGDGYLRCSQPGAEVLARGRRLPVVGRISMDAISVDVSDLPGAGFEEEFVLMGSQGSESITAGELARRRNTIAWEVLAGMAQRVARVYHPTAGTTGPKRVAAGSGADVMRPIARAG